MCHHRPHCPGSKATDRLAAHIIAAHPEQGWNLLCNGLVVFDDNGVLLPDGGVIDPGPVLIDLKVGVSVQSSRSVALAGVGAEPADRSLTWLSANA